MPSDGGNGDASFDAGGSAGSGQDGSTPVDSPIGDASTCTPVSCAVVGVECGQRLDGCGKLVDCGTCEEPDYCGGGGPGKCGPPKLDAATCIPKTCAEIGADCGVQADGCGAIIDCGSCVAPEYCGGGGPNKCGAPTCTPLTCIELGASCGKLGDGCGNLIDCGACPWGQTCGGGGIPNVCGGVCPTGEKQCGGVCVTPAPAVGCSLIGCMPCPAPPANSIASCSGELCDFTCLAGYA